MCWWLKERWPRRWRVNFGKRTWPPPTEGSEPMIEPWFDPNYYAWIPGTLFGVIGGCMGALVGCLAPRGRARSLVLGAWFSFLALAFALLVAGIIALANGQPYGVWFGL